MPRPTKEVTDKTLYLKEQFQGTDECLNALEDICKTSTIEQKEDRTGEIGLLIGKLMVRVSNIESFLGIYDD